MLEHRISETQQKNIELQINEALENYKGEKLDILRENNLTERILLNITLSKVDKVKKKIKKRKKLNIPFREFCLFATFLKCNDFITNFH